MAGLQQPVMQSNIASKSIKKHGRPSRKDLAERPTTAATEDETGNQHRQGAAAPSGNGNRNPALSDTQDVLLPTKTFTEQTAFTPYIIQDIINKQNQQHTKDPISNMKPPSRKRGPPMWKGIDGPASRTDDTPEPSRIQDAPEPSHIQDAPEAERPSKRTKYSDDGDKKELPNTKGGPPVPGTIGVLSGAIFGKATCATWSPEPEERGRQDSVQVAEEAQLDTAAEEALRQQQLEAEKRRIQEDLLRTVKPTSWNAKNPDPPKTYEAFLTTYTSKLAEHEAFFEKKLRGAKQWYSENRPGKELKAPTDSVLDDCSNVDRRMWEIGRDSNVSPEWVEKRFPDVKKWTDFVNHWYAKISFGTVEKGLWEGEVKRITDEWMDLREYEDERRGA